MLTSQLSTERVIRADLAGVCKCAVFVSASQVSHTGGVQTLGVGYEIVLIKGSITRVFLAGVIVRWLFDCCTWVLQATITLTTSNTSNTNSNPITSLKTKRLFKKSVIELSKSIA